MNKKLKTKIEFGFNPIYFTIWLTFTIVMCINLWLITRN